MGACVTQPVACYLGKVKVASSNLATGSLLLADPAEPILPSRRRNHYEPSHAIPKTEGSFKGCTTMIGIESGRDIIVIWMSVCTGAIAMHFIGNLALIIIVSSVYCALTGVYVYRKLGK